MAGFDARDSTSLERADRGLRRATSAQPLPGLRIGLPKEFFGDGLAGDVAEAVEAALAQFEKARRDHASASACPIPGCRCRPITSSPRPRPQPTCRASTACATAIARPNTPTSTDMYCKSPRAGLRRRGQAPHPDRHLCALARLLRRLLPQGAENPPPDRRTISPRPTRQLRRHPGPDRAQHGLQARRQDPTTRCRCICPTSTPSPPTSPACPACRMPCGFGASGLPVGLQLVGNYFAEARMLNVAHQYQLATDWHLRARRRGRS